VSLSYSPLHGTGQLDFNENNAQLARGRTQGRASLRWGSGLRLEGTLRFIDVDLPMLLRSAGAANKIAGGRMSGRLDFGGDNIHSLDDLTGTLEASFAQAQALQLPVLDVVAHEVAPGRSAMTFEKGEARATLSRGVVRVNRLSLSNATLQMLVEGTVTLQGRIDLEATASTEVMGINPNALRHLGARLPVVGPLPAATVAQASSYLTNRVVHLRVTGTVKNPSVHLDPVPLLSDEAIRFFLGMAVGTATP
jgi:translocation and assembly module TamB